MADHSTRSTREAPTPQLSEPAAPETSAQDVMGNAALVEGLTGRTFNRILGASESDTTTSERTFGEAELETYLEKQLEFAKGEWFSGMKISGAAEGVLKELDSSGDGQVSWSEFQAFRGTMLASLAPGTSEGAGAAEIEAVAADTFASLGGTADFEGVEEHTRSQLDPEREHRDLLAQLGALLLLDSADIDERTAKPRDRTLTQDEWVGAAKELAPKSKD